MKLKTYKYKLELKNTFRISHTARDFQETLIVELSNGDFTGYGEAAATSYYGVDVESMSATIKAIEPLIAEIFIKLLKSFGKLPIRILKAIPLRNARLTLQCTTCMEKGMESLYMNCGD